MSAQEPTTTTNTTEQPTVETTSAESKPVPPLPENPGEEAPSPSPSKSNNTPGRRLSVLIGKAKKSITTATEKLTTPDTTHSPTKTSDNTNKKATTSTEEPPSTAATSTTPAPAAEPEEQPVQNNKEETHDKSEKRKSLFFLDNIFNRSKSPTAKEEETKPADEPPVPEASGERSTEDVAPVPPPKDAPKDVHKDTVIDQLKRRATEVNHFFNKKRAEASAPTTETTAATTETTPNDAPAAVETTEQTQGSSTEKKPATQLGRRLTKLLSSFPANKKKADDTAPTETFKKEETKTDVPPLVQDEPIHPAAASTTTPTVQATA
ncbi:hypothetical protein INT45_009507 [Circinella minor]|uniref:Uncharacterized protein n=1 Tax=Circinella minor TaxID=1195481 RepID=A0A8H7SBV2_9FUNG|nr:hypothetical protein INT45_009507 [Circinella minor]